ncbi:MAG TPA: hypothetical protein VGH74_11695 [Planctomycetaceae bacterium]|jgi:tetratricopeptide (TPR) repeat protein
MSDPLPHGRNRRAIVLAAAALAVAGAAAGAARQAMFPDARQLFVQGLGIEQKDPAASESLFRRAIQAAGGRYPDAQIALCQALGRQHRWDQALAEFSSVQVEACRSDLLLAFGRDALEVEQKSAGLQALQAVAQRSSPASVAALERLKAAYQEWGEADEERAAACALTRLESDNPDHWKSLIALLQAQHRVLQCEEALREGLQLQLPDVYRQEFEYKLITILVARGEIHESRRRIADLKKIEGQSFRLSMSEIDLYRIEGRWDQAQILAAGLTPDAGNLPVMYHVRGVVHLDLEQYDEAARDLERAVALRPFNERIHFKLSEAYRLLKRPESAARHAKIADEITAKRKRITTLTDQLRLQPRDATTFEQLVELHEELGDENGAHFWQERARRQLAVPPNSN